MGRLFNYLINGEKKIFFLDYLFIYMGKKFKGNYFSFLFKYFCLVLLFLEYEIELVNVFKVW